METHLSGVSFANTRCGSGDNYMKESTDVKTC